MKKLQLDGLTVDSFATTAGIDAVAGYATPRCNTLLDCPLSYGGTCVISGCRPCEP